MNDVPIRVLLINDDDEIHILVERLLRHSNRRFHLSREPFNAAREAIMRRDIDVCLVDSPRGAEGWEKELELLRVARSAGASAPIILLTKLDDEEADLRAMAAGASDCLVKAQLHARLLERSIRYAIERNKINNELRGSQERIRRVLGTAPVLLFELDREGVVTFVEGTALRILKLRPEDVLGRSAFEVYPVMEDETRRALAGRPFTVTVEISGAILQAHVAPTLDESGTITGAVGVATDITRRVRNERALQASRRELQSERDFINTVLDTMGSLALVLDTGGRIIRFNRACELLTGYSFEEVRGRPFWELFLTPEERPVIVEGFARLTSGALASQRENYWLTRSNQRRLISWSNTVIVNEAGEPEFVVATGIDITDRRGAEEALNKSRYLFQTFMDHGNAGTFIKNSDLRYVFVNNHFAALLGRESDDILGRTDAELFTPAVATLWETADREVLSSGQPVTRVDGLENERHFLTNRFAITDVTGQIMVGGQSIEITERVRAELSLRKSEERFQLAAKATNDAIWDWDLATDTLWWNANVHHLFRYDPASVDITLAWWGERVHPDDHDRVVDSLAATVRENHQFWVCEYRFLCGDGEYAYVLDRGYVMRDAEGLPARMIGAMTDLTKRRQAEDALRVSEERYRRIVETAQEGIVTLDRDGLITFANARMIEMLGRPLEMLVGQRLADFTEERSPLTGVMLSLEDVSTPTRDDMRLLRADGTTVWAIISVTPLQDSEGSMTGALVMVADITDRKRAEAALQVANDRLEVRVAERTAEIVDMMARLERAHEIQQRFVADASHDLRTPLTVMRAELDLLLDRVDDDHGTRASLKRIAAESRRLENMASDLLLLATIDAQEAMAVADDVQLDDLLFDCVTQLQTIAAEREIAWNLDIEEPLAIRCDASMIRRAVTNVMENAVKYSGVRAEVCVRLRRRGGSAVIEVHDTGVGIPTNELGRVFDRFYRGDLTRNTSGTGLGLSIVKAVMEGHGGAVSIDSAPGVGTTVSLRLPFPSGIVGQRPIAAGDAFGARGPVG